MEKFARIILTILFGVMYASIILSFMTFVCKIELKGITFVIIYSVCLLYEALHMNILTKELNNGN